MSPFVFLAFVRSIYFLRSLFLGIVYILFPLDLIPERFFGIIGFIDDIMIFLLIISFALAAFGVMHVRHRHWAWSIRIFINFDKLILYFEIYQNYKSLLRNCWIGRGTKPNLIVIMIFHKINDRGRIRARAIDTLFRHREKTLRILRDSSKKHSHHDSLEDASKYLLRCRWSFQQQKSRYMPW